MLAASPETCAEEVAIHDYEGFGSLPLSGWESFERVSAIAYYVDGSSMAHDMELNGDVFTIEIGFEGVHVFWGR